MTPFHILAVLSVVLARSAAAFNIPPIEGHMTDPTHQLSGVELQAADQKLDKIANDTRIDTAGWITDAPESDLAELGKETYEQWHIGRDWDNGVFLMIPRIGHWRVIQNPVKPELSADEVAKLMAADKPGVPMRERMDLYADTAGEMLRTKIFHARPPGKNDPVRGRWYLAGSMALLLAALARTGIERRARRARTELAPAPSAPEATPEPVVSSADQATEKATC